MILLILDYLQGYSPQLAQVLSYYSTRMILAAVCSLALVIVLGPYFIASLRRLTRGQAIRTQDCSLLQQLHQSKKDTPTMGGGLILFAMLASMFLWMDLTHLFTLLLFITTIALGCLGACDDYLKLKWKSSKGLSAKKKLICQILLSAGVALYLLYPPLTEDAGAATRFTAPIIKEQRNASNGSASLKVSEEGADVTSQVQPSRILTLQQYAGRIYLPFMREPLLQGQGWLLLIVGALIVFVITASSNSVNLTDGLDGLAAGCLIMVGGCLALFAFVANHLDIANHLNILYVEGSGEIAIYLSALVGACIGFLWYNGYPAELFMGDTGSLALGGIIGVSAVLLKREALLAIIGGIFVAETASVILQVLSFRWRNKKRIFLCSPLHHHFECKGWPETKVVIRFWIVGLVLALVGIASLKFQ